MDENKFLEKMRLLKLQETIRIVESKVGLQADKREWEQALSENKVSNVKYMGKTEIDGKWQDIYMVVEQFQKEINGKVNIVDVEKYVTEKAYENPKFVEDILRDCVLALRTLDDIHYFSVECENFESIHNHNAYASHVEYLK